MLAFTTVDTRVIYLLSAGLKSRYWELCNVPSFPDDFYDFVMYNPVSKKSLDAVLQVNKYLLGSVIVCIKVLRIEAQINNPHVSATQ